MDNGTDITTHGQPKRDAWNWIMSNYGWAMIMVLTIWTACAISVWGTWLSLGLFAIEIGGTIAIVQFCKKWYKDLVDSNDIKPFERSSIWAVFKR